MPFGIKKKGDMQNMSNICDRAVIHMGAESKKHIIDFQSKLADQAVSKLKGYTADELKSVKNDLIVHIGRSEFRVPIAV